MNLILFSPCYDDKLGLVDGFGGLCNLRNDGSIFGCSETWYRRWLTVVSGVAGDLLGVNNGLTGGQADGAKRS